jgi:cytochrome c oxidase subunit II
MKRHRLSIARSAAGVATAILAATVAGQVWAGDLMGQPTDRAIDFQPAATDLRQRAMDFHNFILLPVLFGISLLILGLLLWIIYNAKRNPTPARFTHNTTVEVLWTVVPVLILLGIAIPSFRLLFDYHDMKKADVTVKATGYQWYWGYAYPDLKIDEQTSRILPEDQAKARGVPYMLASTQPIMAPVGKVVHVEVTGADVIHSFSVPAFGIKIDAIPGRNNDTWFVANRTGTFYGQCSQLCGTDHSFMSIEVKVVSQADFDAWVASQQTPAANSAPAANAAPAPVAAATAPAAPAKS